MTKFALVSVTDKTGIVDLALEITKKYSYKILASGGTGKLLERSGIEVINISDFTGIGEILNGRVKTLHPRIHAGILANNSDEHQAELARLDMENIDLVVCNLYDFKNAVDTLTRRDEIIEYIDIGGPTLIRAAAKNYSKVVVLTSPSDYKEFLKKIDDPSEIYRLELASKAFALVANYDIEISKYFGKSLKVSNEFLAETNFDLTYYLSGDKACDLRYGENSHQKASVYFDDEKKLFYHQIHGKPVSYNNILDLTSGLEIVDQFEIPCCAIIKHRTPCGVATSDNLTIAYEGALACDKISAYGGVYCFNREINEETALKLSEMFVDTVIAPSYSTGAINILTKKEKLTILERRQVPAVHHDITTIPGGFVIQNHDIKELSSSDIQIVAGGEDGSIYEKIIFAWKIVKHTKSNAIVIASESASFGIASGETSRVDAVRHAIERAGERAKGAILASDAFFPFADSVEMAAKAGISTVVVPRGSIRDDESIKAAERLGITLVFTKIRAFRH